MKRFKLSEGERLILPSQECVRQINKKGHPPQLGLWKIKRFSNEEPPSELQTLNNVSQPKQFI